MERQPIEWKNTFANDTSDKGLISKIYKKLIQLNIKIQANQSKKWSKDVYKHFSKEVKQIDDR